MLASVFNFSCQSFLRSSPKTLAAAALILASAAYGAVNESGSNLDQMPLPFNGPDPCTESLRTAPVSLPPDDLSPWGVLGFAVGSAWIRFGTSFEDSSMVYQYEWIEGGKALRRTLRYAGSSLADTPNFTIFVQSSERGVLAACDHVHIIKYMRVRKVFRLSGSGSVASDWWRAFNISGREELRVLSDGNLESKVASSTTESRPPYQSPYVFAAYTLDELKGLTGRFGAEREQFKAETDRRIQAEAAERKARRDAFFDGLLQGTVAVVQATADAYATQSRSGPSFSSIGNAGGSTGGRSSAPNTDSKRESRAQDQKVSQGASTSQAPTRPASSHGGVQQPSHGAAPPQIAPSSSRPLRFVLYQAMEPGPKARANPTCYSNVITVSAPEGYGVAGFDHRGANANARSLIEGYYPAFIAKCRVMVDPQVRLMGRSLPSFDSNQYDPNGPTPVRPGPDDVQVQM